jgi:hypothetical protein
LKVYHKNPRQITEKQFSQLKKELKELGDLSGIVHDLNSDEIIGGNQRSKVFDINKCEIKVEHKNAKPDKQGTVGFGYVIWEGHKYSYRQVRWTEKQCEKANIIANKAGGSFDTDILANEFNFEDLLEWGFEEKELVGAFDKEVIEDDLPEVPKETKIKVGDIFSLGAHTLICGDSTDKKTIERLLVDNKCDIVFTDPPYDMEYNLVEKCFENIQGVGAVQFWMGSDKQLVRLAGKFIKEFTVFFVHDFIDAMMVSSKRPMQQHTLIAKFRNKQMANLKDGFSSIIKVQTNYRKKEHDIFNMGKGVDLPASFIKHYCSKGVVDIFGGYGSTLIAAEQLGKECRLIELNPYLCDLIIQRWETLTNCKAKKIKTNEVVL